MSRPFPGAPPTTEVALQETYIDLLYMAVETEHLRWVVCPRESSLVTIVLEGLAVEWRRWAEDIAQQLIALSVAPDGRVDTISGYRYHNPVPGGWREPQAVLTGLHQELRMRADWCRSRAELCRSRAQHDTDRVPESVRLLERIADSLTAQTAALSTVNDYRPEQGSRATASVGRHGALVNVIPPAADEMPSAVE
jgi:hypothetical protein